MINDKIAYYAKVGISIFSAYIISFLLTKYIFVDYSPLYRNNIPSYIASVWKQNLNSLLGKENDIALQSEEKRLDYLKSTLNQLAPGVRANSITNTSYTKYDLDKVEWEVTEVTLSNGKVIRVETPKGMGKPKTTFEHLE